MKIAVVATGLDHIKRGVESWAASMARALAARSCDVTLFKGSGTPQHAYEQVVACLPRHAPWNERLLTVTSRLGGWRYGLGSDYSIEQMSGALSLLRELRRTGYDVVHTQDALLASLLHRAGRAGWHRSKVIFANGTAESIERLETLQYIQELSPPYFADHAELGASRRLFLVPNPVDTRRFVPGDAAAARQRLGLPAGERVVLSVGAINAARKRMDWLVREFDRAAIEGTRLVIAGAVERETEALVRWARALLGERLVILADRNHAEMPLIYQAADLFVLCAIDEVFGIAFLEAMASGVPCIGHQYPVTRWVIGDGGVTVDMQGPGELAGAMRTLLVESDARTALARAARRRAVSTFGEDVIVADTLKMYEHVAREQAA